MSKLAFFILFSLSGFAFPHSRPSRCLTAAKRIVYGVKAARKVYLPIVQAGAYPVWFAQDMVSVIRGKKDLKSRWLPHLIRGLGYIAFRSIAAGTVTTTDDFRNATKEFEEAREDDVIVVTNSHQEYEVVAYKKRVETEFNERFSEKEGWVNQPIPQSKKVVCKKIVKKGARVAILIEPRKYTQINARERLKEQDADLIEISNTFGPITKHDHRGHGLPGHLFLGGEEFCVKDIKALPEVKNVYAKDARVRFFSCLTLEEGVGDLFAKAYAEKRMQNGGKIAGTQLPQVRAGEAIAVLSGGLIPEKVNDGVDFFFENALPIAQSAMPLFAMHMNNRQLEEQGIEKEVIPPLTLGDVYRWKNKIRILEIQPIGK